MSVIEDILAFSQGLDAWEQDVMRRLFAQTDLSEIDTAEVLGMLKTKFGLPTAGAPPAPLPLEAEHLPAQSDAAEPVVINSVENVVNANQLANGQRLPFGINGLTIIYGDNGSGKSGYCRILKKLCRVREGGEEDIRGNAFDAKSAAAPAEATLRFTVGSSEVKEVRWKTGQAPPQALSRISVFDAKTAALYADQQNRIEFLPYGLDVLRRLGEVYEKLATALDAEKARVEAALSVPLPAAPAGTGAADTMAKLSKGTLPQDWPSGAQIAAAATWSEEDASKLRDIENQLSSDPVALARRCAALGLAVERVSRDIETATSQLSDAAAADLRRLYSEAVEAREAATLAARQASAGVPLEGFGSEAWRALFKYAKEYSEVAYPHQDFPVTAAEAKCVLCQQPLNDEARKRFIAFDDFVKGTAEKHAKAAEQARTAQRSNIEGVAIRTADEVRALLSGLNDYPDTAAVAEGVATLTTALATRKAQLLESLSSGRWAELASLPEPGTSELSRARAFVAEERAKLEANQDADARRALEHARDELHGRRTLNENLASLQKRRADLDALSRLEACRAACNTNAISRQGSALRKKYVTKDFETRLFLEIDALDLSHLRFKVQERTDRGASFMGVGLETAVKVKNREILSDGEFRALAMACFLTEIGSIAGHSGVIIDDPVSSLDHLRTRSVALRLVREAAGRQVIVFTHDLVFYNELYESAAEEGVPVVRHWIRRSEEYGFGTISQNEEPWQAKPVKQRIDALTKKLGQIKKADGASGDGQRAAVKDLYTDLRETWERLVEELLFNKTVTRFQLGVKTQSINGVEVTDDDYKRVFYGMKRASVFSGHDRAQGAQSALPRHDEMQKDIDSIKTYSDELAARRSKLEKQRRALERPEPGKTA